MRNAFFFIVPCARSARFHYEATGTLLYYGDIHSKAICRGALQKQPFGNRTTPLQYRPVPGRMQRFGLGGVGFPSRWPWKIVGIRTYFPDARPRTPERLLPWVTLARTG